MARQANICDPHTIGRLKAHQALRRDGNLTKTLRALACERMDQIDADLATMEAWPTNYGTLSEVDPQPD